MLSRQTDNLANAVRLLAAMGAFVHKPGVKGGLSLYDAARTVATRPPPSLETLSDELTAGARVTFSAFRDAPADAPVLYEQMVAQGLLTDTEIVAADMQASTCVAAMQAKLTDRAHTTGEMPRLFAEITRSALEPLLRTREYADDLTSAYMRRVLTDVTELRQEGRERGRRQDAFHEEARAFFAAFRDRPEGAVSTASRETLNLLATRFGDAEPEERSDADLRRFLLEKSRDYRRLVAQVGRLDDREGRIANLRAAAQDAIRDLRLDQARRLLHDARAVQDEATLSELRRRAELIEAEAEIAFLENDAEEAHRLLSACAATFDGIDGGEAYTYRRRYFAQLYEHGLRYGGPGLACAAAVARAGLADLDEAAQGVAWAALQSDLGRALMGQGARAGGEAGAHLLAEAVAAFGAALRVRTEADHSVDWATTQNNLGAALQEQGIRTAGEAGARLLAAAAAAYRAALRVWTEVDHPANWAAAQNNLGSALTDQGSCTGGELGTRLLAEAAEALRATLRVYTEADHPVDWATIQNNLGNVLVEQGVRTGGEVGAVLLAEAVEAYRAALRVRTEADYPVDWAFTQNNLGATLRHQGDRSGGEKRSRLLAEAVAAYRAALRVRTEADHPVDWAMTQIHLGAALRSQSTATDADGARLLAEAVEAYGAAARIYTEADHPVHWAMTRNNLGNALREQGICTGGETGARLLADAIAAFGASLRVCTEADRPVDWATAMENLGLTHEATAENETCSDPRAELARAAECFEAALRVYDTEHMRSRHGKATEALERIREKLAALGETA